MVFDKLIGFKIIYFQNHILTIAKWSAVGLLLSIPFSKALFNVSAALMLVGWLLSGDLKSKISRMQSNPITLPSLVLFSIIAIRSLHSEGDLPRILYSLAIYAKLLYIPIIISLIDSTQWQRRCWHAFTAGMVITLIHIYANVWIEIPWSRTYRNDLGDDKGVFYHHVAQTTAISFFTAFSLFHALKSSKKLHQVAWTLLSILSVLSITHLSASRTGQVTLLAAIFTLLIVTISRRWLTPILCSFFLAAIILGATSSSIQDRFRLAYEEVTSFQYQNDYTSVGARLRMWGVSYELFRENPWIGHGTGSYPVLAEKAFSDARMCSIACGHPHNQFLFLAVEIGIAGFIALTFFIFRPIQAWWRTQKKNSLIPVFMIILVLTCLPDSGLWYRGLINFFLPVLALLMSAPIHPEQEHSKTE